jgi:hypothetical protein
VSGEAGEPALSAAVLVMSISSCSQVSVLKLLLDG